MEEEKNPTKDETGQNIIPESVESESNLFDFNSTHTDNFPKILKYLNISLVVTSYQAARLFFVRSDGDTIDINFHHFPRPMGVYADEERLTLGTLTQVLEFKRSDEILSQIKAGKLNNEGHFTRKVFEKDK